MNKFEVRRTYSVSLSVLLILFVSMFLTSCTQNRRVSSNNIIEPTIEQRKVQTDINVEKIQAELKSKGLQIISIGQNFRIIIPTDKLFINETPRVQWPSYSLLNKVVEYIKQFRVVSMQVAGVTYGKDRRRNLALSDARARKVANYFWSQKVDSRIIYTTAFSSNNNYNLENNIDCSVIDISFRNRIV